MFREAAFTLLGEDQRPVRDHVELRRLAFDRLRGVAVLVEVRREAHGPLVVTRSDGAVVDLDAGHARTVA